MLCFVKESVQLRTTGAKRHIVATRHQSTGAKQYLRCGLSHQLHVTSHYRRRLDIAGAKRHIVTV